MRPKFDFKNPAVDMIFIEEIAQNLSQLCRNTGATKPFYSVALHSLIVSDIVPEEFALEGLLHDASEAYLNDIAKPLKEILPDYRKIEAKVNSVIAKKFNLRPDTFDFVHIADMYIYAQESLFFFKKWVKFNLDTTGLRCDDYSYLFGEGIYMEDIADSFYKKFLYLWQERTNRSYMK